MIAVVKDSPGILWHHIGPSRTLNALLLVETALTVRSEYPIGSWAMVSKRIEEVSFIHWSFCPKGLQTWLAVNSTCFC